jgi:hypothetical protein
MIDFFEAAFDDAPTASAPREYEVLAEGEHDVEIVGASIGTVQWKVCAANPEGQCLRVRLSAGRGFAFVYVDIPRERKWVFKALAASLGLVAGSDGKVSMPPPEQLIGRRVRVEVGRYTTRAGETRANVKRWLPAQAVSKAAAKPAPQLQRAARAKPALPANDDIPF